MKTPFPDSILTQKEQEQLAGTWQIDKQALHVAFTSNGIPWLALVEWSGDDFEMKKFPVHFTKRNDALYLSMPGDPNREKDGYYFAEIKVDDQGIVLWNPDPDVFKGLIEGGALRGTVEKDTYATTIRLDNSALEILERISTNAAAFNYKDPLILRKLR